MKRTFILTLLALISANSILAQQVQKPVAPEEIFNKYTSVLSPEKVYLHTDKDIYFATDTIWFSGYVENTSYTCEFPESNYIYVELIADELYRDFNSWNNNTTKEPGIIVRKKILRTGNSFSGHIAVPEANITGRAIIRAYTYWMLNSPAEYMFYKELELANPMMDTMVEAMMRKNVKDVDEYLKIGAEYPYKTKEAKRVYDVQFLPESGNLIAGKKGTIYIKSIDNTGIGASVYGEITDKKGNMIVSYRTDSLGFGKITIPSVPSETLVATIKDSSGYNGKTTLPQALLEGITIQGNIQQNRILFAITATKGTLDKGLIAFIHNGSEAYYSKALEDEENILTLATASLTKGIHSICIVDKQGNIYAQRGFLILPEAENSLAINTNKTTYGKRAKVDLTITVPKNIMDPNSNFSISVTDMGLTEDVEKTTITSYMLLKSELKGHIQDIEKYFDPTVPYAKRMAMGDMLMQTHGWRYYDISKIMNNETPAPVFGREYKQTIFGKVRGLLRTAKKTTVSIMAPSIRLAAMGEIENGYFILENISFPEDTRFIVSANGKNGRTTSQTPILQEDFFAPIIEYPVKSKKVEYTPEFSKLVKEIYYNLDDGSHAMYFELDPVVVQSTYFIPKNSPAPFPNTPINKAFYRNSTVMQPYVKGGYDLASYVASTFSGVRKHGISSLEGHIHANHWTAVHIYLNGVYITPAETNIYLDLLQMPLSEIESVVYVHGTAAAQFQPPLSSTGRLNKIGHLYFPVLMIRTKPDKRDLETPLNVTTAYPLGWQKPAKFYTPKYETKEELANRKKDNRITVYWNPSIKFDKHGTANISFYTNDSGNDLRVEVEGRSAVMEYFHSEIKITSEKKSAQNK